MGLSSDLEEVVSVIGVGVGVATGELIEEEDGELISTISSLLMKDIMRFVAMGYV